jgi:hypothetical protein
MAAAASSLDDPNKVVKKCEFMSQAHSTSPKLLLTVREAANALFISRSISSVPRLFLRYTSGDRGA